MATATNPIPIRLSDEDNEMLGFLRDRLGMKTAQVIRLAIRRLFQSEKAAEKRQSQ